MSRDWVVALVTASVIASMITLSMYATVSVWHECRVEHSILYCLRLVSK